MRYRNNVRKNGKDTR